MWSSAWPPLVPAVVLAEALTGDQSQDFYTNRLLRACQIRVVDDLTALAGVPRRAFRVVAV